MIPPLWEKRLRRAKDMALAPLFRNFHDSGNLEGTVVLASSARSGSTWVQEILNHDGHYRVMFEPFLPRKVPQVHPLEERQYLRPDEGHSEIHEIVEDVLRGRIRGSWVDRFNRKLWSDRRLIKDVRINLMLGWLRKQYPQIRIILMLRHPCAVVASRLRMGWGSPLDRLLEQEALLDEGVPLSRLRENRPSSFESQIHAWCIENLVPLRQLEPGEVEVFFYEELCTNLGEHLPRLLDTTDPGELRRAETRSRRPSALTGRKSSAITGQLPHSGWTRDISPEQRQVAESILRQYGLHTLYGEEVLPRCASDEVLALF